MKLEKNKNGKYEDYLGKEFATLQEMASFYKVNYSTLITRINRGVPLEKALSSSKINQTPVFKNKEGKVFYSLKQIAEFYNIEYGTFF